jgi:hypothetical protein
MLREDKESFSLNQLWVISGPTKSSTQPDDGEGLAKRKGVIVRWGLKEAWSKTAT